MITKERILGRAADEGYGEARRLDRLFVRWQEIGLLGKATAKAPRQGGEGLWHPIHADVFLMSLKLRVKDKRPLGALVQSIVAMWLYGIEGIETPQAQRALKFCVESFNPPDGHRGPRSQSARIMKHDAERFSAPGAPLRSKRELRRILAMTHDGLPNLTVSPDTWAKVFLDAMGFETVKDDAAATTEMARKTGGFYKVVCWQAVALGRIDELMPETPEVFALWEWARAFSRHEWDYYVCHRPELTNAPGIGYLWPATTDLNAEFVNSACARLLLHVGLGMLYRDGEIPWPPNYPVDPPPAALTR